MGGVEGTEDPETRRLLWRCRRGMKELDVLLERYVRDRFRAATKEEREAFAQLLELPDPVLARYLLGRETPSEPQLANAVRLVSGRQA